MAISRSRKPASQSVTVDTQSETIVNETTQVETPQLEFPDLDTLLAGIFATPKQDDATDTKSDTVETTPTSSELLSLYETVAKMTSAHLDRVRAVIPLCGSMMYAKCAIEQLTYIEVDSDWNSPKERILQISETRFKKLDFLKRTVMKSEKWVKFVDVELQQIMDIYDTYMKRASDETSRKVYADLFYEKIRATMDAKLSNVDETLAHLVKFKSWTKEMCFSAALEIAKYKQPNCHKNKNVRAKYFSAKGYKFGDLTWDTLERACFKVVGEIRKTDYVPESVRLSWNAMRPKDEETPKKKSEEIVEDFDVTDELI